MVLVSEVVHPKGLDFKSQRLVVLLRDVRRWSWGQIAQHVTNLQGQHPSKSTCWRYYRAMTMPAGRRKSQYHKCGRRAWKLSPAVKAYLLRTLKQTRMQQECIARTLRLALARAQGVQVEESTIRKFLLASGYRWLRRAQKRLYSLAEKRKRLQFAEQVVRLGRAGVRKRLALAMDGCVLPMPPPEATERLNFLRDQQTHMRRKKSERIVPQLAGAALYGKQTRLDRAIPLWGGISSGGFATVLMHAKKKLTSREWVTALEAGKLVDAIEALEPENAEGPWHVLCDNEKFLSTAASMAVYRRQRVRLWQIPPKSLDLNPVERFWSYLRHRLRRLDLADALKKKRPLGKTAYKARVRAVLESVSAQRAASNIAGSLFTTCQEVIRKRGAASTG